MSLPATVPTLVYGNERDKLKARVESALRLLMWHQDRVLKMRDELETAEAEMQAADEEHTRANAELKLSTKPRAVS